MIASLKYIWGESYYEIKGGHIWVKASLVSRSISVERGVVADIYFCFSLFSVSRSLVCVGLSWEFCLRRHFILYNVFLLRLSELLIGPSGYWWSAKSIAGMGVDLTSAGVAVLFAISNDGWECHGRVMR